MWTQEPGRRSKIVRSQRGLLPGKLAYACRVLPYLVSRSPAGLCHLLSRYVWPSERRHGICIVDSNPPTYEEFVQLADMALTRIAEGDPLRYSRIQNEVRTIIQIPVPEGAEYYRLFRTCTIDIRCFVSETDKARRAAMLACVLIHEATHGYLFSRRIECSGQDHDRIERICNREMRLLAERLGIGPVPNEEDIDTRRPGIKERLKFFWREARNQYPKSGPTEPPTNHLTRH